MVCFWSWSWSLRSFLWNSFRACLKYWPTKTLKASCFWVRYNNIVLFFWFTCANRRRHLDLKLEFNHCVLFHLQSIASMSPLVLQLMSMEAPETSSHTLASPRTAWSLICPTLFPVFVPQSKQTGTAHKPLTFYVHLAVRDPLLCTLQQVVHPSLRGTHRDLTDLFQESQGS